MSNIKSRNVQEQNLDRELRHTTETGQTPSGSDGIAQALSTPKRQVQLTLRLKKPSLPRTISQLGSRFAAYFSFSTNSRARMGIKLTAALLVVAEVALILQPFMAQPVYALGAADSLLAPVNSDLAQRVKYDAQQRAYTFNNGYVPSAPGIAQTPGPRITATANEIAKKGVTVTDPAKKTEFTLKPQFGLLPGKQDGNRIIYPLTNGKGWLVYGLHSASVKEDVVLTDAPGDELTLDYTIDLKEGMESRLEADGSIGVYGNSILAGDVTTSSEKDAELLQKARQNAEKNTLLFTIPAPVVIESGKKKSSATSSFELQGNALKVVTKGLEKANYPLSIDPSIYVETAEKFMRGNNETNIDFDVTDTLIQKGETTGARFDELTSTMPLPNARWNQGTAVAGGYAYVAGGNNGTTNRSNVYWSKFNTSTSAIESPNPGDGACTGWCTNSAYNLPADRAGLSLVAYNGYLYALGGEDATCTATNGTGVNGICKTVYVAKIGANGEPQLWHPSDPNQNNWTYWYRDADLSSPRSSASAVAYNNRMYLLGGKTDTAPGGVSTVEYVNLNPTGTLTPWTTTGMTVLPSARLGHGAQVYNDYLYLIGGNSNGTLQNTVDYIKINDDGSLVNSWSGTNNFRIPRMSGGGNFSAIWGGYLYVSGGCAEIDAEGQCTTAGIANAGTAKSDGTGTSVELASINADGSIAFWGSISNVSNARIGYGLVAWRNTIYTIGGCTAQDTTSGACTAASTDTRYGLINGDGDGSTVATSVPDGTAPCSGAEPYNCNLPGTSSVGNMLSTTAIMNGYLYIIGGCTSNDCSTTSGNTIYAAISADGNLRRPASCPGGTIASSFCVDSTDPIPGGGLAAAGATVFGGRIYIIGGQNGSGLKGNIYHAAVNNDGSLEGAWTTQAFSSIGATSVSYTYAYARANPSSAGTQPGNLYIFGGCTAGSGVGCTVGANTDAVYKCNIDTNGSVSGCSTTGQLQIGTLPGATGAGLALHAGMVYANYIYLVGGVAPGLFDLKSLRYAQFDNNNNVVAASGTGWTEPKDSNGNPVEMSVGRRRGTAFGYNGYLYAVGGYDGGGGGILSDIQFAKINVSNGSLEQFDISTVTINQRWGLSVPVSNSYAYIIGGCIAGDSPTCTTRTDTIQTFQIYNNDSGAPADYSSSANLFPTDRFGVSATVNNGYIYVAGGCIGALDCNDAASTVDYAPLNPDGTIGAWTTTGSLPADRVYGQLEQIGGTLYYLGGQDDTETAQSTIYYATPAADGSIVSWATASGGVGDTSGSVAAARTQLSATTWNDRIYVTGGYDAANAVTNTVFVSPQLSSGGNIAADSWTSATGFNVARNGLTAVAYANNLYILGGHDGVNFLSDVQYTKINADGTLGNWSYTTSLPRNVSHADGFAANGYMYIFGGKQSDIACTTNTYIAPISANTTIASGNNPTGLGAWFLTNERFSAERSGLSAVYNEGKAYLMGGSCGSLEGGTGVVAMEDDLDATIDSTMWASTANMAVGTVCGTVATGNSLYSLGGNGAQAISKDVNVTYGGRVSFYLKIPTASTGTCDAPNSTNEDLVLQYSSNGGSGWTTIATYDESNFNTPTLINETIPSGAWTANTRFRWYIPNADNNRDEWAIDNIVITANDTPPVREMLEDDFDPTLDAVDWVSTAGMLEGTVCGTLSTGNALYSTGGTANAITKDVNLQYGGQVNFMLRIPGSSAGGCDQPGINQNLQLQYSTNAGSTWTTFATYDEGLYDTATKVTTAIPSAAYSSAVRFRWIIPNAGGGADQWAIDDVTVNAFEPVLTFTGIHRAVYTSLLSQPQTAKYSIMFDTDSDVFPTNWLLNGVDNSIGAKWNLKYRSMTNTATQCTSPAMTTWGQDTLFGEVALGVPGVYTPRDGSGNDTDCARFYYFVVSVDSSKAFGYPEDISRGPTITDLTLQFTADPSKRLLHGRTFTGGLQQPIDTPYYAQ